ncbi:NAD(P)H-dependent oxidoreductase [Pseudonocardia xishanensis]|uniref:NAD(P)H-dependent oxidoreductase n=1 Tax=Pseudonocardia xishanensis TaxID=630995 RepID=A0ABP8S0G7_9PSEU
MRVTVVVGNPKPRSRTREVGEALVERLLPGCAPEVIDLVDHAGELFAWPSETMDGLTARVASSDLVVIASPTYKATYTGLLKAFLDRYPANGLAGVVALPVLTGAGPAHSLGVNVHLAPLLAELGATVPGRGAYIVTSTADRGDQAVAEAADRFGASLARATAVGRSLMAGDPS